MSKIKFRLVKFEKRIAFEILEQVDIPSNAKFKLSNNVEIVIYYPFIEEFASTNTIYIRDKNKPNSENERISIAKFATNAERDLNYDKILASLKEFSELISDKY